MTPPPSLRESLVRQISLKGNLGNQVCTPPPPPKAPLPSTSGFVPIPTPTFQPIAPDASPEPVNTHHTHEQQNSETSPESSLPCGQWTPIGSTSINRTPSQHTPPQSVVPPQPATPQSHNSDNTHLHTQSQKTPQSSPTTQPK